MGGNWSSPVSPSSSSSLVLCSTGPPEGCKAIRTEKIILTIICLSSLLRSARQMLVHGHLTSLL
ncbi:hypothetical protein Dimus_012061 [Dionaea muscipula]